MPAWFIALMVVAVNGLLGSLALADLQVKIMQSGPVMRALVAKHPAVHMTDRRAGGGVLALLPLVRHFGFDPVPVPVPLVRWTAVRHDVPKI